MRNATLILLGALVSFSQNAQASWLSEITGIDIDLNRGQISVTTPKPDAIIPMIQNLPKDVGQAMLNPAAPLLASAIRFSRGQALNRGVNSLPPHIMQALSPYFPQPILQKVRWTTADGVSIDGALKNWFNQEGAVTLDEVVVFSGENLASDIALWAHELTHVLQYSQMGVETFAFQYLIDWNGLEQQARDNSSRIMASINSSGNGGTQTWSMQYSSSSSNGISWADVNQAAKQAINPVSCIWINNQTNTTGNACPTPVRVTGVVVRRLWDGFTFEMPCNEVTCIFAPNQAGPLLSPMGHQVIGVTAAYSGF